MTLQTKTTEASPTHDANGNTTIGGSVTMVTTDNGDGKSGLPKVYKNELGQPVIDTREVDYSPSYGNAATVTQQPVSVNTYDATFHNPELGENGHVVQRMVTTVDTRPPVYDEKPVVTVKAGEADVPVVKE